jgi:hypothetical protein
MLNNELGWMYSSGVKALCDMHKALSSISNTAKKKKFFTNELKDEKTLFILLT